MNIARLKQYYKYPVSMLYWYYFKGNYKSLKEWRDELDKYRFAEPNHPIRKFVEMVDRYGVSK